MKENKQVNKMRVKIDSYKWALYPFVFIVLIVYSLIQVNFKPEALLQADFWIKLLFKYLIQIVWIYFGIPDGKDNSMGDVDFVDSKTSLKKAIVLIKDKGLLIPFKRYVDDKYVQDRQAFIDKVLFDNGIDKKVYDLELSLLKDYVKYHLTKDQYKLIRKLKLGQFKIEKVEYNTYITANEIPEPTSNGVYHESLRIFKEILPKLIITFITLAITTAFALDENASISGNPAKWLELVSNIGMSIMSYGFAFNTGRIIIKDYTSVYAFRTDYIRTFIEQYENGKYVPDMSLYEQIDDIQTT